MRGISWLAEELLASQEGLCCVELVKHLYEINIFEHPALYTEIGSVYARVRR